MSSTSPVLHEDRDEDSKPSKLAKRRRKLPTASSLASQQQGGARHGGGEAQKQQRPSLRAAAGLSVEERLRNLSPEVLEELQSTERSDKFMPGEVSPS